MSNPSEAESKWLRKLQRVLNECPTKNIGFYTNGDGDVGVFDNRKIDEIHRRMDNEEGEFGACVYNADADYGYLYFPNQVHSVAG